LKTEFVTHFQRSSL